MKRECRENEVANISSSDGKVIFAITKRSDDLYEFYVDHLQFDMDEDVYYWSQAGLPRPSIFGSVDDAKAEILAQFGHVLIAN